MGRDEHGTLTRLKAHRTERLEPVLARHGGRLVKLTGDGALIEFPSAVDALGAAIEFQQAMTEANRDQPEDSRIIFRIGLHLGDLIVDGDDLYGDGVNVAARLEAKAPAGGIVVSGSVHEAVAGRLKATFDDLGSLALKNIERPVQAFGVRWEAANWPTATPPIVTKESPGPTNRTIGSGYAGIAVSVVTILVIGLGIWWAWSRAGQPPASVLAPVSTPTILAAKPAPRLSIVVLPFVNLSNDPEQEYYVDGITDDLTTDLSRISDSFVIARTTAFTYKGKPFDVKKIGAELGVRYVLEGSVRRSGEQVQVNVQLIDATTGVHLWADRFETNRRNLVDAQNEITGRLAQTLHLELVSDIGHRIALDRAANPDARDLVMRGWALLYRPFSLTHRQEALRTLERALVVDPQSIDARIGIAWILAGNVIDGLSTSVREDQQRAERLLLQALEQDTTRSMAHATMGMLRAGEDRLDEARAALERAIELDKNNAFAVRYLGRTLLFSGQPEAAIPYIEKALRLNPRNALENIYANLGKCHLFLGHVDQAMSLFRKAQTANPRLWFVHLKLGGTLALLGKLDEAKAELAEMVRLNPEMNSVAQIRALAWYRNPQYQVYHDRTIIRGLRLAGFPE